MEKIGLDVIRFLAIGVMVLLSTHLLRRHRKSQTARIAAVWSLCMAVYLIIPLVLKQTHSRTILGFLLFWAFSSSFLFWMFSRSLFSDQAKVGWFHYCLWGVSQLVSYMVFFQVPATLFHLGSQFPEFEFIRKLMPQVVYLAFILAAIVGSQRGSQADLVESRIRLRRTFLAVVAFYGILICAAEIMLQGQPASEGTDAIHYSILLILTGLFFREIKAHPELFQEATPSQVSRLDQESVLTQANEFDRAAGSNATPAPELSTLRKELNRLIEVEKVYRQEGLTIGQLARMLKTQEYRLRACINKELGYRNFNDFLNHYRVQEACSRLRSEADLPILNLSLDLGYRSLAPFNRAFKAKTGNTPTEFRRKKGN